MNDSIKQLASDYLSHPMIQKYTQLPPFVTLRMEWLRLLLLKYTSDQKLSDCYALVASLLQHGLDTHDEVPVNNKLPDLLAFRAMQLKVLAGDYFSSRYYELLAQCGDVKMVRALAEAVCKVNHLKIQMYETTQNMRLSVEQYLEWSVQMKLPVIESFKSLIPESLHEKWDSLLSVLTACEVLWTEWKAPAKANRLLHWFVLEHGNNEEKMKIRNGHYEQSWLEGLAIKYHITEYIMNLFKEQARLFEKFVRQWNDESLEQLWEQFSAPLLAHVAPAPNAVQ